MMMPPEPGGNSGTDFPESVKAEARKLAAFRCCYCREMGDDVHHLFPKEEGGQGVLENAILLCVQCHARYGSRKERRNQLRQAREAWHAIVREKYSIEYINAVARIDELATKKDFDGLENRLAGMIHDLMQGARIGSTSTSDVVGIASTMVNSLVPSEQHVTLSASEQGCPNCSFTSHVSAAFCQWCGHPLRGY